MEKETLPNQQLTITCMKATLVSIEAHLPLTDDENTELYELYQKLLDFQCKTVFGYERKREIF